MSKFKFNVGDRILWQEWSCLVCDTLSSMPTVLGTGVDCYILQPNVGENFPAAICKNFVEETAILETIVKSDESVPVIDGGGDPWPPPCPPPLVPPCG